MNFKSNSAYKKWLGYVHATGLAAKTPGHQKVSIKGKSKKVKHQYGGKLKKMQGGGAMNIAGGSSALTGNPYAMIAEAAGAGLQMASGIPRMIEEKGKTPDQINEMYARDPLLQNELTSVENAGNILGAAGSLDVSGVIKGIGSNISNTSEYIDMVGESEDLSSGQKTTLKASKLSDPIGLRSGLNTGVDKSLKIKEGSFGDYATDIISGDFGGLFGKKAKSKLRNEQERKFLRDRYSKTRDADQSIILNELGGKLANNLKVDKFNPDLSLIEYGAGGMHSENPNGGIPQGIDSTTGDLNTVEENETRVGDYVFSDKLKLDGDINLGLGEKYNGKSFAKISKSLYKEFEERPNDPISKSTWKKNMSKLSMSNDIARILKQSKESK